MSHPNPVHDKENELSEDVIDVAEIERTDDFRDMQCSDWPKI